MNLTVSEIISAYETLKNKFQERNSGFKILRAAYDGTYGQTGEEEGIVLIYNLLNSAVHRYVDYLVALPDIRVTPPGEKPKDQEFADKLEKALYGVWEDNFMDIKLQEMSFNQSLLGMTVLHCRPDPKALSKITIDSCIPEYFYPKTNSSNYKKYDYVLYFSPDLTMETREHPTEEGGVDGDLQYWDENMFVLIRNNKVVQEFEHGLGFVPWIVAQNRISPNKVCGSSDLEQAVGLMDYLNTLFSFKADIIEWAADPPLVVSGSALKPSEIMRGPHSVNVIEAEAKMTFLQWQGNPPDVDNQIMLTQKAIQDMLGLSEPAWGRHLPSGISGATIRESMGGSGARISAKQLLLGRMFVELNGQILRSLEKVYPNDDLKFHGIRRGAPFSIIMKGKEIKEHTRNRVIWKPGNFDYANKLSTELQKMGAGIQSKITTMENLGIEQPMDEIKRIKQDIMDKYLNEKAPGEVGKEQMALDKGGLPEPDEAEEKDILNALLKGAEGEGAGAEAAGGGVAPGVLPEEGALPIEPAGDERLELKTVVADLKAITKFVGGVWLIGAIVAQGFTKDRVDIALTDLKDKATIINGVPYLKGRINFTKVKEKPKGKVIQIKGVVKSKKTEE
jgi:hypothetical protein